MQFVLEIIDFWTTTHWFIAFVIACVVNISVYVITAKCLDFVIRYAVDTKFGSFIDKRELTPKQTFIEMKFGIIACCIFALGSIFSRMLFDGIWPLTFFSLLIQVASFVLFYETYSYFVHRLLHTKPLVKFHSVHHSSVRVTPWSAYSVHPVEATFIGFSAPIFMLLFPLSLSVALTLHILGMMFTILLHSNYSHTTGPALLKFPFSYAEYHSKHHFYGGVNFGFTHRFWDWAFGTGVER